MTDTNHNTEAPQPPATQSRETATGDARPAADSRRSAAAARRALAAARKSELIRARATVRSQLAGFQQHRRGLSRALGKIHQAAIAYRSQVREQLRQIWAESHKPQRQNKPSADAVKTADTASPADQARGAGAGGTTT